MSAKELIADTHSLLNAADGERTGVSRRTALQASVGVGYAAAAGAVVAQTAIKTSTEGLTAGEVVIDAGGFKMDAYRAAPAGKTNLPVILVIQEIFGVHEYIADTCRRFAKLGYMAIAPELYQRQGDPGKYNSIPELQRDLVAKVGDAQVMADLDDCVAWAAHNGGNAKRVGVTGFCWGGRITWLYAAHSKSVKAAVAWYGRLEGTPSPLFPKHPVDVVDQLNAPVLGLYGRADTGIPMESVALMQKKLKDSNHKTANASEFVIYEDTPHAFHADYRASFRKGPAEDGWERAKSWFKQHGV